MLRVVAGIGTVITGIGAVGSKRTEAADKLLKGSEKLPKTLGGNKVQNEILEVVFNLGMVFCVPARMGHG